jgi:hypothetical protein
MSRLARGRAMLRDAWLRAAGEAAPQHQQIQTGNDKEQIQ